MHTYVSYFQGNGNSSTRGRLINIRRIIYGQRFKWDDGWQRDLYAFVLRDLHEKQGSDELICGHAVRTIYRVVGCRWSRQPRDRVDSEARDSTEWPVAWANHVTRVLAAMRLFFLFFFIFLLLPFVSLPCAACALYLIDWKRRRDICDITRDPRIP